MKLLRQLLPLLPTLLELLPAPPQAAARDATRRLAAQAVLAVLALVLLAVAFGFALAGAYLALAAALGRAAKRERERARQAVPENTLAPLHELGRQVEAKPLESVAIAAAAGAIVAWLGRCG